MNIKDKRIPFLIVFFFSSFLLFTAFQFNSNDNITHLSPKVFPLKSHKSTRLLRHRKGILRFMTFNIAHGSNNRFGLVPLFTKAKTIRQRLQRNATIIRREDPDILALQEADGPSWWSGNFHHVYFLARQALFPYALLGIHVKTSKKRYGTALLSHLPLSHTLSYKFKRTGFFKKGFVIATIHWPTHPKLSVDIVSLHLHPSNTSIQLAQIHELIAFVRRRHRPTIIMGDFNNVWNTDRSPITLLAYEYKLKVYRPSANHLETHRGFHKRRLDWIFIPEHFRFVRYRIIRDVISDHFAVVADIAYQPSLSKNMKKKIIISHPTSKKYLKKSKLKQKILLPNP